MATIGRDWSYTKLVKEYGEDIAILLLEFMDGTGEFESRTDTWEDRYESPYDTVHDYLPCKFPMTKLTEQVILDEGASGVDIKLWRKKEPEST